ncbi:MAG: hypothetical protein AAFY71_24420 [Bacteroidota bacterium]
MKHHKVFYLIIGLILLIPLGTYSQAINKSLEDQMMPSPEAAALGKYGDIPVSHATGVPNISIPIHTVSEGPLSLPISLSYHASGVKVAETSSKVGLGWSLNAGGIISRTVMGLPDEEAQKGYLYVGSVLDANKHEDIVDVHYGNKDGEPDMFSFNIGGYSGKFILTSESEVFMLPKQNVKIVPDIDLTTSSIYRIKGFTVYSPDGTKYIFGTLGAKQYIGLDYDVNRPTQASSWYLLKIESADNQYSIDFDYEEDNTKYVFPASKTDVGIATGQSSPPTPTFHSSISYGFTLNQISSTAGNIKFFYDSDREDIEVADLFLGKLDNSRKKLDRIQIEGNGNTYCREYTLTYDYFEDASSYKKLPVSLGVNLRLQLQQIQESTCDNSIEIPPYKFEYFDDPLVNLNGTNSSRIYLPNRLSKAIDHWGFYNGSVQNNSSSMNIPRTKVTYSPIQFAPPVTVVFGESSDRETHEEAMRQGALKKITYPTGGSTEFTFEANDYYGTYTKTDQLTNFSNSCSMQGQVTTNFVLPIQGNLLDELFYELTFTECAPNSSNTSFDFELLKNSSSGSPIATATVSSNSTDDVRPLSELFSTLTNQDFSSGQGGSTTNTYYLTFENTSTSSNAAFTAQIKIYRTYEVTGNRKVGGLRIASIVSDDSQPTSPNVITTFTYEDENQLGMSSGELYNIPDYSEVVKIVPNYDENWNGSGCSAFVNSGTLTDFPVLSDASITPLSSYEGYHISYLRVLEFQGTGNGYTERKFFSESSNDPYRPQPVQPGLSNDFPKAPRSLRTLAGELSEVAAYKEDGTLVSHTVNAPLQEDYDYFGVVFDASACLSGYTSYRYHIIKVSSRPWVASTYAIRSRPFRLETVTSIQDGLSSTVTNNYTLTQATGDPTYYFPKSTETQNSDGTLHKTIYHYPFETTFSSSVKPQILNKYMIGNPWKVEKFQDGSLLEKTESQYGYNSIGDFVFLETLSQFPNGVEEIQEDFTYNDVGKLIEAQVEDAESSSLIWSTYKQKPTAKVFNAEPSEAAYTSFEDKGLDNNSSILDGGWVIVRTANGGWVDQFTHEFQTGQVGFHIQPTERILQKNNLPAGKYVISFWYSRGEISISAPGVNIITPVGGTNEMTFFEKEITLTANATITIASNSSGPNPYDTYIDEVRIFPADAQMSTICYDKGLRIITTTDINNRSNFYIYDALGRLQFVKDFEGNYIQGYEYNYKSQ